ncbi:MAG TPA: hypothetical protein VD928_03850 [Candidatus Paceibacterota bacterium]|nr:hypothetical protein [Candidatus Paceibacterota bacterium]
MKGVVQTTHKDGMSFDRLVDPNTGNVLMDEYMDPAHLALGHEKYQEYLQEQVQGMGNYVLEHMRERYPEHDFLSSSFQYTYNAVPEGKITCYCFDVCLERKDFWKFLLGHKTLVRVSCENGMMGSAEITFTKKARKLFADLDEFEGELRPVANANGFSIPIVIDWVTQEIL